MPFTSGGSSPTVAGCVRRFRFVFADTYQRAPSEKRRKAVAEHVEGWMGARIIREQRFATECVVTVEVARPVAVEIAEQFVRDCPHYVGDTFAACG